MISLASEQRKKKEKPDVLRNEGWIPGVLYGPKTKAESLKVEEKAFGKVYEEAGESFLISLKTDGQEAPVLIREVQLEPLKGRIIHVDFYQPPLDEEIEVTVPLEFTGEAPAVDLLSGTLLKNMHEIQVKALPKNLPHEIIVDISGLATFEDRILLKDLVHQSDVEILGEEDELVVQVVPVADIEAELEQPVEEKVEEVQMAEEKPAVEEEGTPEEK